MAPVWAVLIPTTTIGLAVLVAIGGLVLVRRSPQFERHFSENEVAGLLFSVIGVVYGALLAFVVFATWESFANAQQAVVQEAATLTATYRDTQTFPEPQRSQAQAALRAYANTVMANEWVTPDMSMSQSDTPMATTADPLNPVWAAYRSITAANAPPDLDLQSATDHLYSLELQRHMRHLSGEPTLPWMFWPLLVLGGLIVTAFSYFFHQNSLRGQALMTGVTTAMLAGILLLIFALNQPFTGPVPVSKGPFEHALQQFDAIDMAP